VAAALAACLGASPSLAGSTPSDPAVSVYTEQTPTAGTAVAHVAIPATLPRSRSFAGAAFGTGLSGLGLGVAALALAGGTAVLVRRR
jgi:hypothetical protein